MSGFFGPFCCGSSGGGGGGGGLTGRAVVNLVAGNNNNVTPAAFPGALLGWMLYLNPFDATSVVNGLKAATQGVEALIINPQALGGLNLKISNLAAGQTAGYQFSMAGASIIIPPQGRALAVYDATNHVWSIG